MKRLIVIAPFLYVIAVHAAEVPKGSAATPDLKVGQTVWQQKCQTCHGIDGKGKPAMARMFKVEPAQLDVTKRGTLNTEALLKIVTNGKGGKMPAFKDKLAAPEISAVVAYVQSLGSVKKP